MKNLLSIRTNYADQLSDKIPNTENLLESTLEGTNVQPGISKEPKKHESTGSMVFIEWDTEGAEDVESYEVIVQFFSASRRKRRSEEHFRTRRAGQFVEMKKYIIPAMASFFTFECPSIYTYSVQVMSMKASVTASVIVKTEGSTLSYVPGDLQFDEIFATRALGQIAAPPSSVTWKAFCIFGENDIELLQISADDFTSNDIIPVELDELESLKAGFQNETQV